MPTTRRQFQWPLRVILTLTICLFAPVAHGSQPSAETNAPDEDIEAIVNSNNTFAWAMYGLLTAEDDAGNVFFSPSSIHTALTMTYAGAQGQTAEQMAEALALPYKELYINIDGINLEETEIVEKLAWDPSRLHAAYGGLLAGLTPGEEAGYELHIANALWGQNDYPWLDDFLTVTQDNYGAGLEEVDFAGDTEAARETINTWVEEQTNEKIVDLIPEGMLDSLTKLVLTNAIYFKGDWAKPFDTDATADGPFNISADETVDVPLMHKTRSFDYAETDDTQVLRMPYAGDELSMIIILPKAADGLADVATSLAQDGLDALTTDLATARVAVALPKFTMSSQFSLGDMLRAMGMTDAFSDGQADFTGMSEQAKADGLHISAVVHQAFVDVNEEGTEAAAATAVGIQVTSIPPPPIEFTADHPFVFVIRHDATGTILFIGRVIDPSQDDE